MRSLRETFQKFIALIFVVAFIAVILLIVAGVFSTVPILLKVAGITYKSKWHLLGFCVLFIVLDHFVEAIINAIFKVKSIDKGDIANLILGVISTFVLVNIMDSFSVSVDMTLVSSIFFAVLYPLLMHILDMLLADK